MMRVRFLLALIFLIIPASASPQSYRPAAIVSILVDLSETWHNPVIDGYNADLLQSVGSAVAGAAQVLPKPVAIRYHIIGTGSLARPPICRIDYRPSLIGFGAGRGVVEPNFRKLGAYLRDRCRQVLLAQPPEPMTEITAAILTSLQAMEMEASAGTPHTLVILSDFKEESSARYRLPAKDLHGMKVILLWRTLAEDRRNPAGLTSRVAAWKARLRRQGAIVSAYSDSTAINSPAAFRALIAGDN